MDEIVAMLRARATEPDIVEAVTERSSLEPLDDEDVARLRDAGASEALVTYLQRASVRWADSASESRDDRDVPGDPGRNKRRGFTRAGRWMLSGGIALDSYKLSRGAGSTTQISISPGIGVFVANGLLVEIGVRFVFEEGDDSALVEIRPAYYIPLERSGQFALYATLIGGGGKAGSVRVGTFGGGAGVAMSLGGRAGGLLQFGPRLDGLWYRGTDVGGTLRGIAFSLETRLALWF